VAVGIVQNLLQSLDSADLGWVLVWEAWEVPHCPIHLRQAVLAVVVLQPQDHQDETQDQGTQADDLGLEYPPYI